MKPTRAQLEAVHETIEGLTIDHALNVRITGQQDGWLLVRVSDHWGYEYLRIDRQGLVVRSSPEGLLHVATGQGRR